MLFSFLLFFVYSLYIYCCFALSRHYCYYYYYYYYYHNILLVEIKELRVETHRVQTHFRLMVKFQFSYIVAGTVNHKTLLFYETRKEQSISSIFNKEKYFAGKD